MTKSLTAVLNSFVMSNMTPQFCQFNRGVWQILESLVRKWAIENGTVYVISGSLFDWNKDGKPDERQSIRRMKSRNGKQRVAIPSAFYKVLLHQNPDGTVLTLAFILPNDQTDLDGAAAVKYLADHIRSIKEVEEASGMTLFPDISGAPAAVKDVRAPAMWKYEGKPARSLVMENCRKTAGKPF